MLPVGNPAIGDDFIDRENEIKQIRNCIVKIEFKAHFLNDL